MRTIVLDEPGRFRETAAEEPGTPGPGEALVAVRRVGVCGTDVHAFHGRQPFFSYPRIVGHELGVEVVAVGDRVEGVAPGDTCAVLPYLECGECVACRRGRPNCCARLQVLGVHVDGGMRERFVVPAGKLHPADDLDADRLALVETFAIGRHAVRRTAPEAGEPVLVRGAGPIGLTAIAFLLDAGARVAVLDAAPDRLDFCRDRTGVERCIAAGDDEDGELADWAGEDGPTLVIDATGHVPSMRRCLKQVVHGGRVCFVGHQREEIPIDNPTFHGKELSLIASRNALAADFADVIAAFREGRIDSAGWIGRRFASDGFAAAFADWQAGGEPCIKAVVEF